MDNFCKNISNLLTKRNTQLVYNLTNLDDSVIDNMDSIISKIPNVNINLRREEILCDNLILVIRDVDQFLKHELEVYDNDKYKLKYITLKGDIKTFIFMKLFILDYSSYDILISDNEDPNIKRLIINHFKEYDFNVDQSNISTPNIFYTPDKIADAIKKEMIQPNIIISKIMLPFYTLLNHLHNRTYQYEI